MAAANVTGHVYLVERKHGAKWYAKYRLPDGRQVQKLLGPAWTEKGRPKTGYLTERTADEALQAILADARRGTLEEAKKTGVTFSVAAAEFLRYKDEVRKVDPSTLSDYRGVIKGYLDPAFGDRPLESITPDMIDAYKDHLIAEGRLSNRVIVRHLVVLNGVFKRARRAFKFEHNPASKDLVDRPKVVYTGGFDTYDRAELERLATAAHDSQDAAIYRVAAFTGLRQGELLASRWRDVDFVGGLLHVRKNYTGGREKVPKGKKVRSVPMTPDVVDALGRLKEREHFTAESDLVFCNTVGEHLDHAALRRRFYRALEKAGLRRIRFHDLRHHFGTNAITALDAYAVQSYMGHAHYSTTQRYLHHKPRPEHAMALHQAFSRCTSEPRAERSFVDSEPHA